MLSKKVNLFDIINVHNTFFIKFIITGMRMQNSVKNINVSNRESIFFIIAIIILFPRPRGQQYLNTRGYHDAIMVRTFNYHHKKWNELS